jgi:hypothetical protein
MKEAIKFDEWMRSMHNIHYANNEQMTKAYQKIIDNEKV